MNVPQRPKMNPGEIDAIHALLDEREPARVLEWGGGGSTLYWPEHYPDIKWVTIEHDLAWYDILRAKAAPSVTMLHLVPPDLYRITPAAIGTFDLIIVDCKTWRVECLDNARNLLRPGGVVLLHDFAHPKWARGHEYYAERVQLAEPHGKRRGLMLFDRPLPTKVFGVGLSKTGTVSLTAALSALGFRAKHYPPALDVLRAAEKYDALTDSTVCQYLEILDRIYPAAKFVLTVREIEGWLQSCQRHWAGRKPRTPGWEWNRRAVYGMIEFDEAVFRRVYNRYIARVVAYFYGRPDKLLVLDICGGEGYERLCPFLGLPVVKEKFPHKNIGRTS
jgi:SAM-dependent methyltransferase